MARKVKGEILVRKRRSDAVFALRFYAYGERRYLTLGSSADGWSRERADEELENVLADVRRGIWKPPLVATQGSEEEPTFHEFASEWLEGIRLEGLSENTISDYTWQLCNHLLPFFARHHLSEITIAEVDRYRREKVGEGVISAASINKTITRLAQILEVAVEGELLPRNPARGKRRRLKERKPQRTWLDRVEQITALLDAAAELDAEARVDRQALCRRSLLATLTFAGLRISEALELRWRDIDLAAGRLSVRESKTDAGVRNVDLVPILREELSVHKAKTRFAAMDDYVFPTESGRRQDRNNARRRAFALSVERANRNLADAGRNPLPEGLTPHSLRRTFISVLLALGEDVPYVMRQVGHSDPKVTLSIYAQVMFRGEGEAERLKALVEGSNWANNGTSAVIPTSGSDPETATDDEKPAISGDFEDGHGWFRTSDLSRVKRALSH